MDLAPRDRRGVFLGVHQFTMNIGQVVGPLGAGLIAELFGLDVALYVFAAIVAGCGLIFALTARETLARAKPPRLNAPPRTVRPGSPQSHPRLSCHSRVGGNPSGDARHGVARP